MAYVSADHRCRAESIKQPPFITVAANEIRLKRSFY